MNAETGSPCTPDGFLEILKGLFMGLEVSGEGVLKVRCLESAQLEFIHTPDRHITMSAPYQP